MSLRTDVDFSRFKALSDNALINTSRELSEAINARMYFLLSKAVRITKRASQEKIRKLGLYSFGYYTKPTKKSESRLAKKTRNVQDVEGSIGSLIGRARKGIDSRAIKYAPAKMGGESSTRKELELNARKWIASKLKAIGFLATLWFKPLRRFDRFAPSKAGKGSKPNNTKQANVTSIARVATPGIHPVAIAGFTIGADSNGTPLREYAQRMLTTGFQRAVNMEAAEMKRHLEDKAKQACRDAGFVVR